LYKLVCNVSDMSSSLSSSTVSWQCLIPVCSIIYSFLTHRDRLDCVATAFRRRCPRIIQTLRALDPVVNKRITCLYTEKVVRDTYSVWIELCDKIGYTYNGWEVYVALPNSSVMVPVITQIKSQCPLIYGSLFSKSNVHVESGNTKNRTCYAKLGHNSIDEHRHALRITGDERLAILARVFDDIRAQIVHIEFETNHAHACEIIRYMAEERSLMHLTVTMTNVAQGDRVSVTFDDDECYVLFNFLYDDNHITGAHEMSHWSKKFIACPSSIIIFSYFEFIRTSSQYSARPKTIIPFLIRHLEHVSHSWPPVGYWRKHTHVHQFKMRLDIALTIGFCDVIATFHSFSVMTRANYASH